jgi:hypothetical protein
MKSNEEDDENAGARDSASEADVNASKVALRAWRAIVPKSRRSPRPRTKSTGFWSHLQYAAKGKTEYDHAQHAVGHSVLNDDRNSPRYGI